MTLQSPCKGYKSRFTTVPLKTLSDQVFELDINVFDLENGLFSIVGSHTAIVTCTCLLRKTYGSYQNQSIFNFIKRQYFHISTQYTDIYT